MYSDTLTLKYINDASLYVLYTQTDHTRTRIVALKRNIADSLRRHYPYRFNGSISDATNNRVCDITPSAAAPYSWYLCQAQYYFSPFPPSPPPHTIGQMVELMGRWLDSIMHTFTSRKMEKSNNRNKGGATKYAPPLANAYCA